MNLRLTRLHFLDEKSVVPPNLKTGVSLHCHTRHSREMLDFVPRVAEKLPVISRFWERERKRYLEREGKKIDFSAAYWTPPLSAREVYDSERQQINDLGLNALVSLTDHDDICAGRQLRADRKNNGDRRAPISLEWTVPFEEGFFHLGIHNLPETAAVAMTQDLLDFTFAGKRGSEFEKNRLNELFAVLNETAGVLVVLNHPLWDIGYLGDARHQDLLELFLAGYGGWIHAFEMNGFRSWSENKAVLEMAGALGFPAVSGGDRHGCQPNSIVNLTASATFDEFVEQVRFDKFSQIVLMPRYRQPLMWRQVNSFAEIVRFYPDCEPERRQWIGRVYVRLDESGAKPLSHFWKRGGPRRLKWTTRTLCACGSPAICPVFRLLAPRKDVLPKNFPPLDGVRKTLPPTARFGADKLSATPKIQE